MEHHVDVLIVGAGLSGIGAAYHLQQRCPDRTFALLEGRSALGGTWDLFRYPGIRSDSDMYTLGYAFKPWTSPKAIADGASILHYIQETAREHGIERHIRFNHRVVSAAWSSTDARWTVTVEAGPDATRSSYRCSFLLMCSGYYRYSAGYSPQFADQERFGGQIIHPQHWPADFDPAGKRIIVVGSGATAVTLVPALSERAAHVTMLQRSPTYIISRPAGDALADRLRKLLPLGLAYRFTRWKNVLLGMLFFQLCRRFPNAAKRALVRGVSRELADDCDVETHFTPRYNPWDQRVCLVPDGDLFEALRSGRADVVTATIDRFTPRGIRLSSGEELDADTIVTATGLELTVLGDVVFEIDGRPLDVSQCFNYKGVMLSGVPNLAVVTGYTNASWTLKADLTSDYVCRVLNHMATHGHRSCLPTLDNPAMKPEPFIDFSSGYVQRSVARFPKLGPTAPWRLQQNYVLDLLSLRLGRVDDGVLKFS